MSIILQHSEGDVVVSEPAAGGRRRIAVIPRTCSLPVTQAECESAYPVDLIALILSVTGPRYLCDELMRDESPGYVRTVLRWTILGHISEGVFAGKEILDFGCGAGASTMILARMFPDSQIVGVDMDGALLSIARARKAYYGYGNIRFERSRSNIKPPDDLGAVDFVVFNGVFEHLLPTERAVLFPRIWEYLRNDGVLFITGTPHRYSPWESHTTGLPLLNYIPDRAALTVARRLSRRLNGDESWERLLRSGVRGASEREVMAKLATARSGRAILLRPHRLGLRDKYDLWYSISNANRPMMSKKILSSFLRGAGAVGIDFVPYLSLAVRKECVS